MGIIPSMAILGAVLLVLAILAIVGAIAIHGALWLLIIGGVLLLVAGWPARSYYRGRMLR
jgi:hypothetical protein